MIDTKPAKVYKITMILGAAAFYAAGAAATAIWISRAPKQDRPPTIAIWLYALLLWPLTVFAMVRSL